MPYQSSSIAEGFERQNNNEFIVFLRIAKASCAELLTQLYIAREIERISSSNFAELEFFLTSFARRVGGFISYLKSKKRNKEFVVK
ncbi:MAG: four helix bundle protein [Candidatus Omnitrophica bacterium]|nr:four helix bundle protein [Candidatus Omnitrophota bacterium]